MTDPQNPWQNQDPAQSGGVPWQNPVDQNQVGQNPAELYPASQYQAGQNPVGQYPVGQYPAAPEPAGPYQVSHVGQASFAMAPLPPVPPQEMRPPRPATVTTAMWVWIVAAVLSIAVIPVLLLSNMESITADLRDSTDPTVNEAPELAVQIWAILSGFGMLVAAAPYIAFAIVLRNGHNWARITLTILGALGFVSMIAITVTGLQAPVWQAGVAIGILVLGLTIAAIVLQFLPASNKYVR